MAAPVITSATLDKTTVPPGGSAVLTVVATDPDNRVVSLNIKGSDTLGAVVTGVVALTIGDPVTVTIACADPKVTVTPLGGGKFTIAVSA